MRKPLVIALTLTLVGTVTAFDLGNERPAKPEVSHPVNVPAGHRQGGDTILDAVPITLPYSGSGTTTGYSDDYDEICPYHTPGSPDVVYSTFTPAYQGTHYHEYWDIDLLGSTYDTKLYVYDGDLNLVACNDDFYSDYVSKLEELTLRSGVRYYIVIDGYDGASGDYVINITPFEPCEVDVSHYYDWVHEQEPPLKHGYIDAFNGGCNSPDQGSPFDWIIGGVFCGRSGWFDNSRDTDWFEIVMGPQGIFEVFGDAEFATYMFELGPTNCDEFSVIQDVTIGPCTGGSITIPGAVGSTIWFWVGPTTFGDGPVVEYDYVLYTNDVRATENFSWSEVKALFE